MKGNVNLYITRIITDTKTGKIIKKYRRKQSKSFVKAFMQTLEAQFAHASGVLCDAVSIKDTAGANHDVTMASDADYYNALEAPANTELYGVHIGIGTTAPTVNDYAMETKIAHGSVATKMEYGACGVGVATVSGSDMELNITRPFVNSSGGSITVKEVGIVCATTIGPYYHLITRDAVDDAVADGQTYTVTYTLTTTV